MEEEVDYKELMWEIYPQGFRDMYDYHHNAKVTSLNDAVTDKELYESYLKYSKWWDREFGGRDAKYMKSEDKKLYPEEFIKSGTYKRSFVIAFPNPKRDEYLFGGIGLKKLQSMLLVFKSVYNKEAKDEWIQNQRGGNTIRENKPKHESTESPF